VYLAGRADKEGSELFVIEESTSVSSTNNARVAETMNAPGENMITHFSSPFTDGFTLHVAGEESAFFKMEILSLNGKIVEEAELACNTQHHIPATAWTNGMYLMKIRTTKGSIIQKVVKYSR
jgi:hypothetical protein